METIEVLNQRLKDTFGALLDGRPRYRLVWTTTQTEVRKDNYNVYYGSIYLRTEENVIKEVPKYPFDRDRFALEYHTYEHPPNLISFNGSYEPVWIFRDKNGDFIYPNWAVLSFMIKAFEGGVGRKLTPSDIDEQEQKELLAEIEQTELELEDAGRSNLFAFEQTAVINKTDYWKRS